MTDDPPPAVAAASLILMRDRAAGPPEILIAKRSTALVFAGGAYVFPGGRVDPEDRILAERHCPQLDPDDGAARIAAARETIEETAITVGLLAADGEGSGNGAADFAQRLAAGARFDASALTPFARWRPQHSVKRRFDTRFYLAEAPAGNIEPAADGSETTIAFWASAEEILARCEADDGFVIFPTRRLLERLARFPDFAAARDEALRLPHRVITPAVVRRADGDWLEIPADAGYPVTAEKMDSAMRE